MRAQQQPETSFEAIRARYAAHGQDHVFRFWGELDAAARARLLAQAAAIDPASLRGIFASRAQGPRVLKLAPAPIERLPEHGGDPKLRERARAEGEERLRAGRVAALVVAGGQGTRLGFGGPKGAYPLGPVTGRTLFGLQAQKIRRARSRYGVPIPWYVMTSPATDAPTRELFAREGWFGLPEEDVTFFCQGTAPALDFEGRLLLERKDRIAESPNGHGGTFSALVDSGALERLRERGITTLSYYQVDNPLAPLLDPVLIGLHALRQAEMSCKVVRKREPGEKMGVVALIDGRIGIVEYIELDDAHRHARDASGELVYWAGSIAMHAIELDFAERVAAAVDELLPYHLSAKKIPHLDPGGRRVEPREPNGYKLERFVFDALPSARSVAILEVRREEEYSPVKNAAGPDSPETARASLIALYRRWLRAGGIAVPEDRRIEIDHSVIDSEEDARQSGIRRLEQAGPAIRVAKGVS